MQYPFWHIRSLVLLLVGLLAFAASASTYEAYRLQTVAPHLHTQFSDGAHELAEVVDMVTQAGYSAAWITDHSDIYWEYPVLGTTVGYWRNSLRETGFGNFLDSCRTLQEKLPDTLVIPGFEAAPFYYWNGSPLTKLVNRQWMKHLIVAGIEDPKVFHRLPMIGYHTSRYKPGFTDYGEAPYQDFVGAVRAAGGMVFWAHPTVNSERKFGMNIEAKVMPYTGSLLTVPGSNGIAVKSAVDDIAKPGGIWDQALREYCTATRPVRPLVVTEIDYHKGAFPASATLGVFVSNDTSPDAGTRKQAILAAIGTGRSYVTNTAPAKLALESFSITEQGGASAILGETLQATGPLTVSYSLKSETPLQYVRIIRDGEVVFTSENATDRYEAPASPDGALHYYRLAVQTTARPFLLTQPIFVQQAPMEEQL